MHEPCPLALKRLALTAWIAILLSRVASPALARGRLAIS